MVIHVRGIKKLPLDDYLLIEEEHPRLERLLHGLHETCCNLDNLLSCQGCDRGELASCRGRLPSYIHDLIDLVDMHFFHEESIMLSRPQVKAGCGHFRLHRQAHANIMRVLNSIAREYSSLDKLEKTYESYRHFYKKLSDMFEEHDHSFDVPLFNPQ